MARNNFPLDAEPSIRVNSPHAFAGVIQWQNVSFPSSTRGFDSLRPLHLAAPVLLKNTNKSGVFRLSGPFARFTVSRCFILLFRVRKTKQSTKQTKHAKRGFLLARLRFLHFRHKKTRGPGPCLVSVWSLFGFSV
jgi:hypothetical protein